MKRSKQRALSLGHHANERNSRKQAKPSQQRLHPSREQLRESPGPLRSQQLLLPLEQHFTAAQLGASLDSGWKR